MRSHNEPAKPVSRLATAVPANDTMSRGLRPTRSDSLPRSGALKNWAAENAATSIPTDAGPAPVARVKGQEGDDDAEAEEVDRHRGPQHAEPGRRPRTLAPAGHAARHDERASDMGHSRGQRSTQGQVGAAPRPAPPRPATADEASVRRWRGRTSTAWRPLGPSFISDSTGCPSSRLW